MRAGAFQTKPRLSWGFDVVGGAGSLNGIRVNSGVIVFLHRHRELAGGHPRRRHDDRVQATGNTDNGIELGWGCTATGCSASDNSGIGIYLNGSGGTIADSVAYSNDGTRIAASWSGVIRGCSSAYNDGSGIVGYGNISVMDCMAVGNTYPRAGTALGSASSSRSVEKGSTSRFRV